MTEIISPIPSRLKSAVVGGHVAGADQIVDDNQGGKSQEQINFDVINALGTGGSVDSKISSAVGAEAERAKDAERANAEAISNEATRAQGAESALSNRITPLEQAVGTGGNIDKRIADATKGAAFIDASDQGSENVNW